VAIPAAGGLTCRDRDVAARYATVVPLIGLCGVAVGMLVQLHHVVTHPVVADDEAIRIVRAALTNGTAVSPAP
jgi:hypothetical protein